MSPNRSTPAHDAARPLEDERLLAAVRSAARTLAAELEQARLATGDWRDGEAAFLSAQACLHRCLDQLAQTGCWGEANRLPSSELWRIAGDWLSVGDLQNHARCKPRGYAGDFEMLAKICRHAHCAHPLGKAFDWFFQSQAAPQAVRNRTRRIAGLLAAERRRRGGPFHALSLGAGPAIDVQQACLQLSPDQRTQLRVTLADVDPAALQDARTRLQELLPAGHLHLRQENLHRLPRRAAAGERVPAADFAVCSGLFDYLADEDAAAMLGFLWRRLAPGGLLLVFNFAPHNPSRAYMEWIGNWYLLYRDRQQLARLARLAALPENCCSVGAESLGVNLFLQCRKTTGQGLAILPDAP